MKFACVHSRDFKVSLPRMLYEELFIFSITLKLKKSTQNPYTLHDAVFSLSYIKWQNIGLVHKMMISKI